MKRSSRKEWIGGIVEMPAYVTGEGEPFRPEAIFWVDERGAVLGSTMGRPGETLSQACDSLRQAMEEPQIGLPHSPSCVRVSSPELAEALRAGYPRLELVCGPTPEIDEVVAAMRERISNDEERPPTYLPVGSDRPAVAAFFEATAELFRAAPWKIIPDDETVVAVTIEELGIRDAALVTVGQMGESLGIILFANLDDFEAFLELSQEVSLLGEEGLPSKIPPHFAINFERGADLESSVRKEIDQHRWPVAGPNAYPWPAILDADRVPRPPTPSELRVAEALARALPRFLKPRKAVRDAWTSGEPVTRTISVPTHGGKVAVTMRTPAERHREELDSTKSLLGALLGLTIEYAGDIDPSLRREVENDIVSRFAAAPESHGFANVAICGIVMDLAAMHFGGTFIEMSPSELREVVLEILPARACVEPSAAKTVIEQLRAFYAFLKRDAGFPNADAYRRVLGRDTAAKLEKELAEPGNFGMSKTLFLAGREAGFDVDTPEGREAWMESLQGDSQPPPMPFPELNGPFTLRPPKPPQSKKARKSKRKAAAKSRRKNR